jgi:hypothetical protein
MAVECLVKEVKDLCALIEATSISHPLVFCYWFEYEDQDLDIASWKNSIRWFLPEIVPHIPSCTPVAAHAIKHDLDQYLALPDNLRSDLLRSMNRFALSQCRRQTVDQVLDLTLAFEIAVSG